MRGLSFFSMMFLLGAVMVLILPAAALNDTPLALFIIPSGEYDQQSLTILQEKANFFGVQYQIITLQNLTSWEKKSDSKYSISVSEIPDTYTNRSEIALVILGGEGYQELANDINLQSLIQDWAEQGHYIGAIGQGSAVLAKSGILKNISATVLPESALISILKDGGARYVDSPGVLTDTIITARKSEDADAFGDALFSRIITDKVISATGILYLGDTLEGTSTYIIPQEVSSTQVRAVINGSILPEWNGHPFIRNSTDADLFIQTGMEDWTLACNPKSGICVVSDPFTEISIPYGTIQNVRTDQLGEKRDFSTVSGKVSDLFPHTSFREIIRGSAELDESNRSLKDWTDEVNTTNKTISDSLGDLFDDISIPMPTWNGRLATVCVKGRVIKDSLIDIRTYVDDPKSSVLNSDVFLSQNSCSDLQLNDNYPPGSSAYIIVAGEDDLVVATLPIVLPE